MSDVNLSGKKNNNKSFSQAISWKDKNTKKHSDVSQTSTNTGKSMSNSGHNAWSQSAGSTGDLSKQMLALQLNQTKLPPPPNDSLSEVDSKQTMNNPNMALKFLVSALYCGSVIGKGGNSITSFQRNADVVIKVSQNNDYYPGENRQRVVMVQGTVKNIMTAMNLIVNCISDEHETYTSNGILTFKLSVPEMSAGMIIGRGGVVVKKINQESNARVSLQDRTIQDLYERILLLTGTIQEVLVATSLILCKMAEDLKNGTYRYVSTNYQRVNRRRSWSSQSQSSQSQPAQNMYQFPIHHQQHHHQHGIPTSQFTPAQMQQMQQMQQHIQQQMQQHMHMQQHQLLLPLTTSSPVINSQNPNGIGPTSPIHMSSVRNDGISSNNLSNPNQHPMLFKELSPPQYQMVQPQYASLYQNAINQQMMHQQTQTSLSIPSSSVGAVLGIAGNNVKAIQAQTGAKVRISSKHETVPGTTNRILYISGTHWAVQQAQIMCVQKIHESNQLR